MQSTLYTNHSILRYERKYRKVEKADVNIYMQVKSKHMRPQTTVLIILQRKNHKAYLLAVGAAFTRVNDFSWANQSAYLSSLIHPTRLHVAPTWLQSPGTLSCLPTGLMWARLRQISLVRLLVFPGDKILSPLNSAASGWMNEGVTLSMGPQPALASHRSCGMGHQMPQHLTCYIIKEIIGAPDLGM